MNSLKKMPPFSDIKFLDDKLITDLHITPKDKQQYLLSTSLHPESANCAIVYNQNLRWTRFAYLRMMGFAKRLSRRFY